MFALDELASGVGPVDAPTIAADLGVDPGQLAGWILASFFALAIAVEPALLRWSERHAVRWIAAAGLASIAAIQLGASLATSTWMLLASLALYGPASGLATSAAEGALVEARPEARERTMARVVLVSAIGDLAVPGLVALAGWRASFGVGAAIALALVLALAIASTRSLGHPAQPDDDDDDAVPRLRDALRHRPLVGWTFACALTGLLDEIAAAFAAVHLHATFDGATSVAIALTAWTGGNLLGLAVLDRLLAKVQPMVVLGLGAALSLPALGAIIVARDLGVVCVAVAVFGACAASFYPLVKARTYAALPGHPGVVNAIGALFSPIDLALPLALGRQARAAAALRVAPAGHLGW